MYTYEQRMKAVQLYIKSDKDFNSVYNELGYPSPNSLLKWYKEFISTGDLKVSAALKPRFTREQIEYALKYYYEHGQKIVATIRAIGYPSRVTLSTWIAENPEFEKYAPDTCNDTKDLIKYSTEQKKEIVIEWLESGEPAYKIAAKYSVSKSVISQWKKDLLGKKSQEKMKANKIQSNTNNSKIKDAEKKVDSCIQQANEYIDDLEECQKKIEELNAQIKAKNRQIYELNMEVDALKVAGEILKKGEGINLAEMNNSEKTDVINALKSKYRLTELLKLFHMKKSSFYYQKYVKEKPEKYADLRKKIAEIFENNNKVYGYRRINSELKKDKKIVSDKVVLRIMHEEDLDVYLPKKKKYSSYIGEISESVPNIVNRNFHSDNTDEIWLTDITEFAIPAGKIYLSAVIDCYDGMVVSWSIGTSPNAELANSMLLKAVKKLKPGEHPVIHSDRGCHYRWPEWIRITEEYGLTRSMSMKGCSPDNSACEGFFGRLKNEMFYNRSWSGVSIEEFENELDNYIHWYNEVRVKQSLGYLSPVQYRQKMGVDY
ncbi:MAG: IS3 family transposase [Oscillospiraceae bacterium]